MPDNLALRMRPRTISEVIGQKHLVGEGKYSPYGRSEYAIVNDSLRATRNREDLNS